ncbi:hypothetical protein NEMBOFW57_003504 [Staphylotrichum longicolle]|uniref:Heterokaryon incompatibility domain-containing protein n=1 Tax=Staphylotrichum longicolle TaxID=669026 RepID=A0AAD4FA17_9PEZI|nr:hypothetical protein NEMBOFW57_003504 [Staphylotrichum longicolle]
MGDFTKTPRPFYPPLSSDKREIRLLHLEAGDGDAALQCRLSVASLDLNPSYEALSYCWGNGTSQVLVDGHPVLIPRNLDAVLRRFRHSDRERILWADAICIDQSQTEERNAQVALMADIYSRCERCLIFLGNTREDDGLKGLEELLIALSKKHHLDQPDAPRIRSAFGITSIPLMFANRAQWWGRIWVVQEVILAPQSLVVFGSLEMPFSDLVRAVEFLDEHDIGSAWAPSRDETDDLCHCMDHIKVTFIWADLLALRDHVYRLLELARPRPQADTNGASAAPTLAMQNQEESPDIVDVLLSVRHRHCTDSRDKIFGVLSLVRDWGSWKPLKADYAKAALQVFIEFAAQMLRSREYGPKALLLATGAGYPSRALTGLPSWAPDWYQKGSAYDKYLITLEREAASQPSSRDNQSVSIVNPTTIMLHHALPVGKITAVTTPGEPIHKTHGQPTDGEGYRRFTAMLEEWRTFAGVKTPISLGAVLNRHYPKCSGTADSASQPVSAPTQQPSTGTDTDTDVDIDNNTDTDTDSGSWTRLLSDMHRSHTAVDFMPQIQDLLDDIRHYQAVLRQMDPDEETFYRTLVHNTYPFHLRRPQHQREALCILRLLLVFCGMFVDPDRFLTRLNSVVLGKMAETLEMVEIWRKRLMRVEGGSLGIGPEGMRAGDEVFCFRGVGTPFVLRRLRGTIHAVGRGQGGGERYELIGYCYVDGLERDGLDWEGVKEIYLE